jgi:hypothetical protein
LGDRIDEERFLSLFNQKLKKKGRGLDGKRIISIFHPFFTYAFLFIFVP